VRSSPTAHLRLRRVSACHARAEPATCPLHQCGRAPRPRGRAVSSHTEAISFSNEDDPHSCKSVKLARGEIHLGCYGNLILLSLEMPEALIYHAGAEGGGCATKQPFRNSILVLSAKFPGRCNYGIRCRMESFVKGSRASRGVVGTFYDPSSYSNRRRRHPHSISPEPTRLLHVKLLSRELQKTPRPRASIKPWTFGPFCSGAPPGGMKRSWPGDAPDDDVRLMLAQLDNDFRDKAPLSAGEAAIIILDGVRARAWRILVGENAKMIDSPRQAPGRRRLRRTVQRGGRTVNGTNT
jgi:hypothetical protein